MSILDILSLQSTFRASRLCFKELNIDWLVQSFLSFSLLANSDMEIYVVGRIKFFMSRISPPSFPSLSLSSIP